MTHSALVEPDKLLRWIEEGHCVVFDCRFNLNDTDAGREAWLEGHVPGAVYAHLDDDLSGPVSPDSGRHPLPHPHKFAEFLGRSGWKTGKYAVAYDGGGGMIAARFWWLMKYFSLDGGLLLDGGLAAWRSASLPIERGPVEATPSEAPAVCPRPELTMTTLEVEQAVANHEISLVDARAGVRFRGEMEPLDTVAGHVPGAINFPCDRNLVDNRLMPPRDLRDAYRSVTPGNMPVVHMCGSGVTACLNLLAMEEAGFTGNRLYVGSWSEWIRDSDRPVAKGD